jgi:hypothetical protein
VDIVKWQNCSREMFNLTLLQVVQFDSTAKTVINITRSSSWQLFVSHACPSLDLQDFFLKACGLAYNPCPFILVLILCEGRMAFFSLLNE